MPLELLRRRLVALKMSDILIVLVLRTLDMKPSVESGALQVAATLTESQLVAVPPGTSFPPPSRHQNRGEVQMQKNWVASSWVGLMIFLTKGYLELMMVCTQSAVASVVTAIRDSFWMSMILVCYRLLGCDEEGGGQALAALRA